MGVKVKGIDRARRELRDIEEFLKSKKPMQGIVEDIKEGILEKTAAGHDYRGRNFSPYSEAYKKRRAKQGLSTKPNLSATGAMLGALKTEVIDPGHGRVSIPGTPHGEINADMLAQIHTTGTGKQPQREFMNITKNAKRVLAKKHYDDPLLAIVRRYRG